jgi:tetratricopeptide (TPR) repeat protein
MLICLGFFVQIALGRPFDCLEKMETADSFLMLQDYDRAACYVDSLLHKNFADIDARFIKLNIAFAEMADYESYCLDGKKFMPAVDSLLFIIKGRVTSAECRDSLKLFFFKATLLGAQAIVNAKTGNVFQSLLDGENAYKIMHKLKSVDPSLDQTLYSIGLYDYYTGVSFKWLPGFTRRREQGLRELRLAASDNSMAQYAAKSSLCWILLDEKRYGEADSIVSSVLSRYPDNTQFLQIKSRVEFALGNFREAIARSQRLIDLAMQRRKINWVDILSGYQLMAASFQALGSHDNAVTAAQTGLRLKIPRDAKRIEWVNRHLKYLSSIADKR